MEAFNSAWESYRDNEDREATANKIAWSAVKKQYKKDEETGKWKKK